MTDTNPDNEPCDNEPCDDEEYLAGPSWKRRNSRRNKRREKKQDLNSFNWDTANLDEDYFLEGEWEKFYGR
jgi:hypothetical protein